MNHTTKCRCGGDLPKVMYPTPPEHLGYSIQCRCCRIRTQDVLSIERAKADWDRVMKDPDPLVFVSGAFDVKCPPVTVTIHGHEFPDLPSLDWLIEAVADKQMKDATESDFPPALFVFGKTRRAGDIAYQDLRTVELQIPDYIHREGYQLIGMEGANG